MQDQILIVDDHPDICESLSQVLNRAGYKSQMAYNGFEALEAIRQGQFSAVITDIDMPKMSGLEVLQKAKVMVPDTAVIIMTGYGTIDSAVQAMKYGAYDYITKPIAADTIKSIVQKATTSIPVAVKTPKELANTNSGQNPLPRQIITGDPQMLNILDMVKAIAPIDSTILVQGESGTGKELIARAIHRHSLRYRRPFVGINCAALPESLIESELFGHERGAFTGAVAKRIGKLELAHGGTILLDEVSEMAKQFQAKLLRAIQEREVVRIGGTHPTKVDIRIVATTNKMLLEEVDKGEFREDLFYRLCVIPILLPPLRERVGDIPLLSQYFTQRFCTRMRKDPMTISPRSMELLKEYPWYGNVRELENTIERAVALTMRDVITPDKLIFSHRQISSDYISLKVGTPLRIVEQEFITKTLDHTDGNKQKAADILGITSKTVRSKLRQYGCDVDDD